MTTSSWSRNSWLTPRPTQQGPPSPLQRPLAEPPLCERSFFLLALLAELVTWHPCCRVDEEPLRGASSEARRSVRPARTTLCEAERRVLAAPETRERSPQTWAEKKFNGLRRDRAMFAVALVGALSAPKPVILVADVGRRRRRPPLPRRRTRPSSGRYLPSDATRTLSPLRACRIAARGRRSFRDSGLHRRGCRLPRQAVAVVAVEVDAGKTARPAAPARRQARPRRRRLRGVFAANETQCRGETSRAPSSSPRRARATRRGHNPLLLGADERRAGGDAGAALPSLIKGCRHGRLDLRPGQHEPARRGQFWYGRGGGALCASRLRAGRRRRHAKGRARATGRDPRGASHASRDGRSRQDVARRRAAEQSVDAVREFLLRGGGHVRRHTDARCAHGGVRD